MGGEVYSIVNDAAGASVGVDMVGTLLSGGGSPPIVAVPIESSAPCVQGTTKASEINTSTKESW